MGDHLSLQHLALERHRHGMVGRHWAGAQNPRLRADRAEGEAGGIGPRAGPRWRPAWAAWGGVTS